MITEIMNIMEFDFINNHGLKVKAYKNEGEDSNKINI